MSEIENKEYSRSVPRPIIPELGETEAGRCKFKETEVTQGSCPPQH